MDIFTLALYVAVIGWTIFMVVKLVQVSWRDHVENKRARRLRQATPGHFEPKHGRRTGWRK